METPTNGEFTGKTVLMSVGMGSSQWTYVWNRKKGDAYYLPSMPSR